MSPPTTCGPGTRSAGTLTLGNRGEQAGRLMLSRARLSETPGPGGGRLSDVLELRVDDVSGRRAAARS